MRLWIWRFAVAPPDAREKKRNISAQLQSLWCITAQIYFGKFTSCRTFGWHKLVRSVPFWTTCTKFDTCCQRYIATYGKYFIQMRIYVLVLKLLRWTLKKSVSYLNEVVRTNFFSDFWVFEIFYRNFAHIVAPPGNGNGNCIVHLKERFLVGKAENRIEIDS